MVFTRCVDIFLFVFCVVFLSMPSGQGIAKFFKSVLHNGHNCNLMSHKLTEFCFLIAYI